MQITIKNIRSVASAELTLDKITLVGGHNATGKTSIAKAVASALTGDTTPYDGMTKSQAGCLVRSGTAAGSVELSAETGTAKIEYPRAAVKTDGQPPRATEYAAGLCCVLDLPSKQRSETLSQYLKAEPTKDDLIAALETIDGLKPEHHDQIWKRIEQHGWDGAHAESKEKGARLKGQWEQITGQRYGVKKAASWIPDGYSADLDGASEDDLQAAVVDTRERLEGAIAAEAVDEAKLDALEEQAATMDGLEKQLPDAEEQVAKLTAEVEKRKDALRHMPPATNGGAMSCPHCHKSVAVVDGQLQAAAEPLSKAEIATRKKQIAAAEDAVQIAEDDRRAAVKILQKLRDDIDASKRAAAELKEAKKKPAGDDADVDAARNAVEDAENRLENWQKKTSADNRHYNIGVNAQILKALAADGVRLDRLRKSLSAANAALGKISGITRWGNVELTDDLEATLNGTPYHLLSGSEKYRVRVTLQFWMAQIDGSAALIIDGSDVLVDKPLRNGLFRLLAATETTALVAMALPDVGELPDVAAKGLGTSYWMGDDGVLVPRAQAVGAA